VDDVTGGLTLTTAPRALRRGVSHFGSVPLTVGTPAGTSGTDVRTTRKETHGEV